MLTTRLKISDFWIYPSPLRRGDWRATRARPFNRSIQRQHIKPNRFAWKLRQMLFDFEPDYLAEERFDPDNYWDFPGEDPDWFDEEGESDFHFAATFTQTYRFEDDE